MTTGQIVNPIIELLMFVNPLIVNIGKIHNYVDFYIIRDETHVQSHRRGSRSLQNLVAISQR